MSGRSERKRTQRADQKAKRVGHSGDERRRGAAVTRGRTSIAVMAVSILVSGSLSLVVSGPAHAAGGTRLIPSVGTVSFAAAPSAADAGGIQNPEFPPKQPGAQAPATSGASASASASGSASAGTGSWTRPAESLVNRSKSDGRTGGAVTTAESPITTAASGVRTSFDGLNLRDQRLANGGNQFTVEPADQGLCAGNGYVMESVNDVLRVFDTAGRPLDAVTDLNSFYGYPAQINRGSGRQGPFVIDPSCHFDPDTNRWFQVALTLDVVASTGAFTGTNHLDIAVSNTPSPLGAWTVYRVDTTDDGTNGTPDHGCGTAPGAPADHPDACLGDYPHLGADAYGFYVTTNEYDFFGPNYHAAQVYAFSKRALASRAASVAMTQFDTVGMDTGKPGFTVWPATAPAGQNSRAAGGTEYFLSSDAAEEASGVPGGTTSRQLLVWSLAGTSSLDSASPTVSLRNTTLEVDGYSVPPRAQQKAGPFPLGQCLDDTTTVITSPGSPITGCWKVLLTSEPAHGEVEGPLDANDTRMQQVVYSCGLLYGALDTALRIRGRITAGIEYFVVRPVISRSGAPSAAGGSGYLGLARNNLTYPAVGVTAAGKGVIAFTVVGDDYYPSAGITRLGPDSAGEIRVVAAGKGPQDGFSEYTAFAGPPRPRWGDYGATAVVDNSIWVAGEYVAQSCTFAQYVSAPFGSCGGTRVPLGNWATRITKVTS
jgi:hypothetical protein